MSYEFVGRDKDLPYLISSKASGYPGMLLALPHRATAAVPTWPLHDLDSSYTQGNYHDT
jgi:hypothetical protein